MGPAPQHRKPWGWRGLPVLHHRWPGSGRILLILAGTLAGSLSLSHLLQSQISQHLTERLLASQTLRIHEQVDRFDLILRNAERSVERYASLLSSDPDPLSPDQAQFERILQRDADGSWRMPRRRFDPRRDANAWIPPDVPLTAANKRFFLQALAVTRSFGQGALHDPLINSWMLPLINGMTAYWPSKPDYLYDASSSLDYRQTPWVTLTDPKRNPGHQPRWVGPSFDPAAKDWSISVVAPFFRDGRWAGSVGHDMVVSRLVGSLFAQETISGGSLSQPLFVANTNGVVLAKPRAVPQPGEQVPPSYRPLLKAPQQLNKLTVIPEGSNYLVVAAIPTLHAKLFSRVDGAWLRQTVSHELLSLQIGQGLFVLLLVGAVTTLTFRDAQFRRQQQTLLEERNRELSELARRDQLTTLPNRLGLIEQANQALDRARRSGSDLMLVFLDLDRFKLINDSLGHDSGDALLQAVAERLRRAIRSTDMVARQGGDEFVLIIEGLGDPVDAGHIAQKLQQAFEEPLLIDGQPMPMTASIGVSVFPEDGDDIATLMRKADLAMYEVKSRGRNGWLFFTEEMNEAVQQRLQLERDIRQAIDRDQFRLYYQPQWTIDRSRLIGWEALLRWEHPEHGLMAPGLFVPVAEETGLIIALGRIVLREACLEAARWQREGLARCGVSVNVSIHQFEQDDLVKTVEESLAASGLQPEALELEITETVMLRNPSQTLDVLNRLRVRGVRVAIDDFGTGYSSLSYLSKLPIDRLKIDRSFVNSSLTETNSSVIIEAVISLARSLGISTIAEGVETEDQRHFLAHRGCEQIQGYLMGRPMPAASISAYLSKHPQLGQQRQGAGG